MAGIHKMLLSLAEAASRLGVSKITLRRWSDSGEIPCVRIGKRRDRRFKRQDIEDYLKDSELSQQDSEPQILVVEDDKRTLDLIEIMLKKLDYIPILASCGEEAIAKAVKTRPDLALMDIQLPGKMDGVEIAKLIQDGFSVPVIFLSAHADEETVQRAKMADPYGYIVKPFQARELYSAIEIALDKHNKEMAKTK